MTDLAPPPLEPVAPGGLRIHVTDSDDRSRVVVAGELDLLTSRMLLEHVGTFAMARPVVALDLADVTFMDSTGLRALWTLRQRCTSAGKRMVIERPSDAVMHLLRTNRLEKTLAISPTGEPADATSA